MPSPNKALRRWLDTASPAERKQLATAAGTSVKQLEHIASGRRNASAALAQRIVHASQQSHEAGSGPLDARQLCEACAKCPLVNKQP